MSVVVDPTGIFTEFLLPVVLVVVLLLIIAGWCLLYVRSKDRASAVEEDREQSPIRGEWQLPVR